MKRIIHTRNDTEGVGNHGDISNRLITNDIKGDKQ